MAILNLGIVAHVDAGKTTLTERLLYEAGVIAEVGSVDRGNTQTDTLALERQRGITIKSAVVSFAVGDVTVNLIDTPGHPDFIAEVERVLTRTLQRLHIPTLLFINKIDRAGADGERVLRNVAERLTPAIVPLGTVAGPGTRGAGYTPYRPDDPVFVERLVDLLAEHDEALLADYLKDEASISFCRLRPVLAALTGQAVVHPVFFGSAITGAGVASLMTGIAELLPAATRDAAGPVSGTVFKVERGPAGEKIAYVRMVSGTLRTRDRVRSGERGEGKVTVISVFDRGPAAPSASVAAGQIGKLWGLPDIRIGDTIDEAGTTPTGGPGSPGARYFAPPALEAALVGRPADKAALHEALRRLAEQDPLINLRQDDRRGELYVSLYGEVQKEVIQATLACDYNLQVDFRETSVICIERLTGRGEAVERLGKGGNPFLATVGLRIEPAPAGTGIELRLAVDVVSIPLYIYKSVEEFHAAMEDTVRVTLQQGLCGWQVADCLVTLTSSGYASPASTARDFRLLTPLVLMDALHQAGTEVCEPIQHFRLEIPADTFGAALPVLARTGAVLQWSASRGSTYLLEGEVPAARLHELQQQLPGMSRGEGVLEAELCGYRPVSGPIPTRPRSDHNPLNRKEYLLHVVRRV